VQLACVRPARSRLDACVLCEACGVRKALCACLRLGGQLRRECGRLRLSPRQGARLGSRLRARLDALRSCGVRRWLCAARGLGQFMRFVRAMCQVPGACVACVRRDVWCFVLAKAGVLLLILFCYGRCVLFAACLCRPALSRI
jgi:hypothetical protein